MHRLMTVLLVLLLIVPTRVAAADQPTQDLDAEIVRLRRELSQVQSERVRNRQESEKDRQDLSRYTERVAARFTQIKKETDSIKQEISRYTSRNDSLSAQTNLTLAQRRQADLNQDYLRLTLAGSCDTIRSCASRLPPLVRATLISSCTLLKSELSSKKIDNTEAVNRLHQIINQMDDAAGSIQVVQETSTLAEIRGTIYRFRYGGLFECAVDVKGERCAVWTGYNADATPRWKMIADRAIAVQMLRAAEVREGKALPDFVQIPLDAGSGSGGAQ